MCEGDEEEKEIGGTKPSVKKEETSEEDPEEEEDPDEEILASSSLPMDIDATEDYLRFIEDLERRPEPSPLHNSQASVPDLLEEASDRQSDNHNASSYDLSGVWQAPLSGEQMRCSDRKQCHDMLKIEMFDRTIVAKPKPVMNAQSERFRQQEIVTEFSTRLKVLSTRLGSFSLGVKAWFNCGYEKI
ncbi:hypothetical protein PIB30_047622 [Stylosanthes scabra]|uniref:Uncharacterized protein n=1 Tax=Stylosanthes scabra TaxID=79078 RepID=A0ABU6SH08_9FABA|nr:hypothetical protein [Stylosanthes scabra]